MQYLALLLFTIAALLGGYLITFVLQKKNTPKGVAITHGAVAALGLIALIIFAWFHAPMLFLSVLIFVAAALGGVILFFRDITGNSLPTWLAVGHGTMAIIGFVFFVIYLFLY